MAVVSGRRGRDPSPVCPESQPAPGRRSCPAIALPGDRPAGRARGIRRKTAWGMARILVVDDEALVCEALEILLSRRGHEVTVANDGLVAVRENAARPADLAIVDILMPVKEGLETIRELRRDHPTIRIIAISGGSLIRDTDFLGMAAKLGADLSFRKPVEPKLLLRAVDACLEPQVEPIDVAWPARPERAPAPGPPDLKLID